MRIVNIMLNVRIFAPIGKVSTFICIRTAADIYKLLLSVEGIKESDFGTQGLASNVLTLHYRHILQIHYFFK